MILKIKPYKVPNTPLKCTRKSCKQKNSETEQPELHSQTGLQETKKLSTKKQTQKYDRYITITLNPYKKERLN